MASKRPIAPETSVRSFPTPNINDLVVVFDVDCRLPGYKPLEYGDLHPDQTRFPGAKLVYQQPLDGSDQFVRRIYATDRADQDAYNYAIKYSAGSPHHPIYIRSYVELRSDYVPLDDGSPDPQDDKAIVVEEEVAPLEGELNSLYVRVTRVFETLPGPVLTSYETNEVGQKVTVTTQRKASKDYQLPAISATSTPSAAAEDTGVVTEQIRSVASVFGQPAYTRSKEDVTPPKFRAAVSETVVEQTVEGTAEMPPTLSLDEISKTEEQTTLTKKRIRTQERTVTTAAELTHGQAYVRELGGGTATVVEKYGSNPSISPGFGTIEAQKEELGDGKFVTREVVLAQPPELTGQEYDEQLDVVFPFVQQVVSASNAGLGNNRVMVSPQDVHHSVRREVDVEEFRQKAFQEHWKVPAYIEVNLPDILESVTVVFAQSVSSGGATGTGASYSIQATGSTSVSGDARVTIRNGYNGPVPATRHVFFVDKSNATIDVVLQKTDAANWPSVFTRPEILTVAGGTLTLQKSYSFSMGGGDYPPSNSSSQNYSGDARVGVVTIQPTLHGEINITQAPIVQVASPSAPGGSLTASAPTLAPDYSPKTFAPTNPPGFPVGDFLVNVDTESYKYGLVRVSATVAHIGPEYV